MSSSIQSKKSFLIVDKQEGIDFLTATLEQKYPGALIYSAKDVTEAFQKLHNAPPTLVVMELELPKANALTLLERMRRVDTLEKVPVILTTIRNRDDELVRKCLEKQVTYLEKPFEPAFFAGLAEGLLSVHKPIIVEKELKAGEILFRDGDPCGSLYLIKSGSLNVYKENNGEKIILGTLKESELVGEMAFIDHKPRSANVCAASDSRLIELPIKDLEQYLATQPVWLRTVLTTLLIRLRSANDIVKKLSTTP